MTIRSKRGGVSASAIAAALNGNALVLAPAANASALTETGYSLTGSSNASLQNWAGTINTTGVVDVVKYAITATAFGPGSSALRVLGGASATTDLLFVGLNGATYSQFFTTDSAFEYWSSTAAAKARTGGNRVTYIADRILVSAPTNGTGTFQGGFAMAGNVADVFASDAGFTRRAAANVIIGPNDGASPTAQTLSTQGSRAGTDSNVGGGNLTLVSGNGTGTGTVSTLALQSPVAVASGTGAQTLTTGLTIKVGTAILTSYLVANLPAPATAGAGAMAYVTDATATTFHTVVVGGGANKIMVVCDGISWFIGG